MRCIFKWTSGGLLFLAAIFLSSICTAEDAADVVDQFKKSTDLQQAELVKEYMFSQISGKGVVANVEGHDAFYLGTDERARYYKVVTDIQNTPEDNPYIVSFFYKTQSQVKDIVEGQPIEKNGAVLKILDEKL